MLSISVELAELLAPRIFKNVEFTANGCWNRTVNVNSKTGYSHIVRTTGGVRTYYYAHRVAWVHANSSEIPDGMTIDHKCENRACVNPAHLRPMTVRDNVLRSTRNPFAVNARKTECIHGHPLRSVGSRRVCDVCNRAKSLKRRARKAESA